MFLDDFKKDINEINIKKTPIKKNKIKINRK
jgi:hypothetical protein